MSVMACDREGCEKLLCDRWSREYGYICYYCFEEALSKLTTHERRLLGL